MNQVGNELYMNIANSYLINPSNYPIFPRNSIIFPKNGGAVFTNKKRILLNDALVDLNTGVFTPYKTIFFNYIFMVFKLIDFREMYKGTALPTINSETLKKILISVPPLSEQKRIVEEIESIFKRIDEVKSNQEELARLKDGLKNKILDLAIQGKLVSQDPNDEPASVLLEKIKAEKAELVKQGKIKKDKQESYIYKGADNRHYEKNGSEVRDITDEIPFKIPESWEWCRLGNICQLNPRNVADDNLDVAFIPMNLISDGFQNKHAYTLRKWCEVKQGFTHFANNDVGVAKITPCFENRKSVIFLDLPNRIGAGTTELHIIRPYCNIIPEYILALCKTDYFVINGVKNFTGTAGQQRINSQFVRNLMIPLPPIQEQYRIVQKITKMLEIINLL